jgi:hypothetical protein
VTITNRDGDIGKRREGSLSSPGEQKVILGAVRLDEWNDH